MLSYHGSSAKTLAEVKEVEEHFHTRERWMELASVPNGEIHRADRVGTGAGSFIVDAGNNDWGAWVQVLGSSDTPIISGMTVFDAHRMEIRAVERASTQNILQIAWGASGAAALAADTYSEVPFEVPASFRVIPFDIKFDRRPVGEKVWVRGKVPGQDTGTIEFIIGVHEYLE